MGTPVQQALPAVFLDRDGVINEDHGHICNLASVDFIPAAISGLRKLSSLPCRIFIITNQSVVARGLISLQGLFRFHMHYLQSLQALCCRIDGIYACPHFPDPSIPGGIKEYLIPCTCRKPGTALLVRATAEHATDLSRSFFVGDSTSDILAGQNFGLRSILVETGQAGQDGRYDANPDLTVANLDSAVDYIADWWKREGERLRSEEQERQL